MMVDSSIDSPTVSSQPNFKGDEKSPEKKLSALVLPPSLLASASELVVGTNSTESSTLLSAQRTTPLVAEATKPSASTINEPDLGAVATFSTGVDLTSTSLSLPTHSSPKVVHQENSSTSNIGNGMMGTRKGASSLLGPVSIPRQAGLPSAGGYKTKNSNSQKRAFVLTSSSCGTSAMDIAVAGEGKAAKKSKTTPADNCNSSSSSSSRYTSGRWTDTEHLAFLQGLATYGREWKRVALHIPTRTSAQVRSHAQKYFAKCQAEQEEQAAAAAAAAASIPTSGAEATFGAGFNGTDSFRAHVARILQEPETVQAEVNDTLSQLRQRYSELQQQLRLQQQRQLASSTSVEDDLLEAAGLEAADQDGFADANSSWTSHSVESLQDEELIALHVLRGGLPNRNFDEHDLSDGNSNDSAAHHPHDDSNGTTHKSSPRDFKDDI